MATTSDSATLEGGSNVNGYMGWDRVSKACVLRRPWGKKCRLGAKGEIKFVIYSKTKDGPASRDGDKQREGGGRGAGVGNPPLIFTSKGLPLSSRASGKNRTSGAGSVLPTAFLICCPSPQLKDRRGCRWLGHSFPHSLNTPIHKDVLNTF